jgi:hypothetical protein
LSTAPGEASPPARHALLLALLGLAGVVALAYLRVLVLGDTFAVRDHLTWTLPSRAFLGESLRRGHLPEWWDMLRLGERFAADPNNGVTYPVAWLVAIMDPLLAADVLLVLHILLMGVGLWLFARRLGAGPIGAFFGAGALMLSGYVTSMNVNGSILMSLGWMPLVAWAALGVAQVEVHRDFFPRALVFALVLAGSVASGNPAHLNNIVLAGAIVALCAERLRPALLALFLGGLLGSLMGAASLLAPLHTMLDSTRAGGLSLADSGAWSMHPLRLVELVWPQFLGQGLRPERSLAWLWGHGGGRLEPVWSASDYIGLPVLLPAGLAALRGGRPARRLGVLSLLFLLLALGTFTPAYRAYRALFLFERVLRYPEKHLATALVLWSALAALGFDRMFGEERRSTLFLKVSMAASAALGLAVAVGYLVRSHVETLVTTLSRARGIGIDAAGAVDAALDGGMSALAILLCLPLALWLIRRARGRRLVPATYAALVLAQLVAHDWGVHVLLARDLIRKRPAILSELPGASPAEPIRLLRRAHDVVPITVSGEVRAVYLHQLAQQNEAARFGFDQLPGYSIAGTARFDALANASGRANLERIMDVLDIRYLIIGGPEAPGMGMPMRGAPFAGHVVLENSDRRPRAFVAYRWQHDVSDERALAQLFAPDRAQVDLGAIRLSGQGDTGQAPGVPDACRIERPLPEEVLLHCRARAPGYAVLLDEWTQGWTATLDARSVPIERADTLFRAVAIPPGDHRVVMRYATPGLRTGAVLALVGWALFAALSGLSYVRRLGRVPRREPG